MSYFEKFFSAQEAQRYLKENYGYDINFFFQSVFVIDGYWPSGHDQGRKTIKSLIKFYKQQAKRLESLERKIINSIINIETNQRNFFQSISPLLMNRPESEYNNGQIINRYKLKTFFKVIDRWIDACKETADLIKNFGELNERRGAPESLISKVASVWALIIKNRETGKTNWRDIEFLFEWLKDKLKKSHLSEEIKDKVPDAKSIEREYYRMKDQHGEDFLKNLKNHCINFWRKHSRDNIQIQ